MRNTNRYHRPAGETEEEFTAFLLDDLEQTIDREGPDTIAMVIMEPVQNAGGSFTPPAGYFQGVRELCDRYGILLCADEVITGFGRLGAWFGSELYDIRPGPGHLREGPLVRVRVDRRRDRRRPRVRAVPGRDARCTRTGSPSAAIRSQCAIALKNLEIMKRERIVEHVRENEDAFRATLAQLLELPIVGDLRGVGCFYALELVQATRRRRRRSPTRSASRCCAASSRRSCSSAA